MNFSYKLRNVGFRSRSFGKFHKFLFFEFLAEITILLNISRERVNIQQYLELDVAFLCFKSNLKTVVVRVVMEMLISDKALC